MINDCRALMGRRSRAISRSGYRLACALARPAALETIQSGRSRFGGGPSGPARGPGSAEKYVGAQRDRCQMRDTQISVQALPPQAEASGSYSNVG